MNTLERINVELQERIEREPDTVKVDEILEMRSKYLAIGIMILVASGMYLYFRKSGWFD